MATAQLTSLPSWKADALPHIYVEHVSKEIASKVNRVTILSDVSFEIPRGSLFAINGPSGSGKSTLLNILTGIDRPTAGRVLFDGKVLQKMSENRLARWRGKQVGIVFQFFQLLPTLTARENVLLALELGKALPRRRWQERTDECLKLVGMERFGGRLPSELSGGQQQRVAIARALANDPPILVADEPTGNLDSKTSVQIFDLLASLAQSGKTVIYVTHDPTLAERATARLELLDGRVVHQR
jgi:putative ABC transport system ATP-binding protein